MSHPNTRHRRAQRVAFAAAALSLAAASSQVPAEGPAYSSKPVRVVVPYAPGGGTDLVTRLLSDSLRSALGTTILIDNRGGAGGTIGTDAVAKAAPDGQTLLITNVGLAFNAHLFAKLPYDTMRDLAPVTLVANQPNVLVVHPSLPVKNVAEFIAFTKARPGAVTYASGGNGSATHLAAELLKMKARIDIAHVPYKGTGPALTDVMGGHVQVFVSTLAPALPQIQAGKLRALAVTSAGVTPSLPDVAPLSKAGVPGYEFNTWHGMFAPAATPKPLIARLNTELRRILATDDIKRKYAAQGLEPVSDTPEEFGAFVKREIEKWGSVVRAANVRVE
jgi:tripartite-type tricarboxylate transporter receptor subunit TctC